MLASIGIAAPARSEPAASREVTILGGGTRWATEVHTVRGRDPGPTVLVLGGVHGNEPAGARAARQIAGWRVIRGRLVVIPRCNVPALEARTRLSPGVAADTADLNRCFPHEPDDEPRGELARLLWSFVVETRPDWIVDLHEGVDFSQRSDSVGNSVIAPRDARSLAIAAELLEAVEPTVVSPEQRFSLKRQPVARSLARAARRRLGIPGFILETTSRGQRLSLRTRQHRILVHRFLDELAMGPDGPDVIFGREGPSGRICIALHEEPGASEETLRGIEAALGGGSTATIAVERAGPEDLTRRALAQFDVVVIAGGRDAASGFAALGGAVVGWGLLGDDIPLAPCAGGIGSPPAFRVLARGGRTASLDGAPPGAVLAAVRWAAGR